MSAGGGRERQVGEDGVRGAGGGVADGVGREAGNVGDGFDDEAFIVPPDELLAFDEVTRLCCVLLLLLCFVAFFFSICCGSLLVVAVAFFPLLSCLECCFARAVFTVFVCFFTLWIK